MIDFNMDIKTRDTIIFGDYEPDKYLGGTRDFKGMNVETLKKMVEMKFADPDEAQNGSPRIEEFIDFMESNEGYKVDGYVVTDQRADYRVSVEAIEKDGKIDTMEDLEAFIDFARCADEFDKSGYAWWD